MIKKEKKFKWLEEGNKGENVILLHGIRCEPKNKNL